MDNNLNNGFGEVVGVIQKAQGDQKYLFGTIRSDKVKNVTFVPVIETGHKTCLNEKVENGYQRPGSLFRMRAFARFLKDHPNSVVPPVLLSGRGNWQFEPSEHEKNSGRLVIQDQAAIVDGQHRLGGFVHLYESDGEVRDISFILLPDLTVEQETKEFVVVNDRQKGVPKPLTAYLEATDDAQVAWGLNEETNGPFTERITRTNLKPTHLFKLHSVGKQVKRLFSLGALQDLSIDQKIEFMSRFWIIIADQLDEQWSDIEKLDDPTIKGSKRGAFRYKLLELTGLVAWAYAGAQIFFHSYSEEKGMHWDYVIRLVKAASQIDWDKNGKYDGRTGEAGGRVMSEEMIRLVAEEATGLLSGEETIEDSEI